MAEKKLWYALVNWDWLVHFWTKIFFCTCWYLKYAKEFKSFSRPPKLLLNLIQKFYKVQLQWEVYNWRAHVQGIRLAHSLLRNLFPYFCLKIYPHFKGIKKIITCICYGEYTSDMQQLIEFGYSCGHTQWPRHFL